MGIPVLVLGESGSGKSASLRNFGQGEITVFNVAGKPLPFRTKPGSVDIVKTSDYRVIGETLKAGGKKCYVIDDSQYLLCFELFNRANETGYAKFTDIAVRFRNMIGYIVNGMPDDVIVYLLHHTEIGETGRIKAKTVGKMLDNQLTVEGLFAIVLLCKTDGTSHKFITQSDGFTPAKSPMEMFPLEIDNDLKMVDESIREYYGMHGGEKGAESA